jgi:CBS domain-containing protein
MPTNAGKNTLTGMRVKDAMRRQVVRLKQHAGIDSAVKAMIKYKISALLITDEHGEPLGVVSKTDILGAYYAGLPINTPAGQIMNAPPLFAAADESIEQALDQMRTNRIYRLYVRDEDSPLVIGALAYPDIVGMLYKYCHACEYSKYRRSLKKGADDPIARYTVKEVMTPAVKSIKAAATLNRAMEMISMNRFGAVLVVDHAGHPAGVISKTDLILAYLHHIDPVTSAEKIMTFPVRTSSQDQLLEDAVREMILADVQRLFIHGGTPDRVVGVLSLSDAARIRSGSCHACISSRIQVEAEA